MVLLLRAEKPQPPVSSRALVTFTNGQQVAQWPQLCPSQVWALQFHTVHAGGQAAALVGPMNPAKAPLWLSSCLCRWFLVGWDVSQGWQSQALRNLSTSSWHALCPSSLLSQEISLLPRLSVLWALGISCPTYLYVPSTVLGLAHPAAHVLITQLCEAGNPVYR